MTIGERVLELIHTKGMTQKEFSECTGIPQSTISDWRRKKQNPGSDKIMSICDVLGIDPYYLISGTEGSVYKNANSLVVYDDSDEYLMLIEYRKLNADSKKRLLGYAQALKDLQTK